MTSWPWMKGVEVAIADPIEPVCPEDERPSVKALIEEHAEKISKIKAALEEDPLYDSNKHDDLWILRFWLSHQKSKNAIDAAKYTLAFRQEHNLDEKDIRQVTPNQLKEGLVAEYLACWAEDAMALTLPHPQRGVIGFMNAAGIDPHATVARCKEEHWVSTFTYCSEWTFQWLDFVTRTTGRLTKTIRIIDASGVSMSFINVESNRRDGRAMALMEDCYPQLLGANFVCNAPIVIRAIWKLLAPLLPKRVLSKFDIINPKDNKKDGQKMLQYISNEDLPNFYGGKNPLAPQEWAMVDTSLQQQILL